MCAGKARAVTRTSTRRTASAVARTNAHCAPGAVTRTSAHCTVPWREGGDRGASAQARRAERTRGQERRARQGEPRRAATPIGRQKRRPRAVAVASTTEVNTRRDSGAERRHGHRSEGSSLRRTTKGMLGTREPPREVRLRHERVLEPAQQGQHQPNKHQRGVSTKNKQAHQRRSGREVEGNKSRGTEESTTRHA